MPWRWAWLNVSAEGAKICDNFQQEEIPVPEHFTDAIQLVSRGVHFLEVAENVAVVADRAYVAAGLDHRVDKGGDLAFQHKPPRFTFRHVRSSSSNARRPGEKWRG
ncbi:hypothetical protein EMEDMD4_1350012 [Sinorhizobium medicae]|uniref:Uncharacterized protein n=1 Tax=Sinorhizobium medicae TaxID=110321 RepID=A0A508WSI6_9HYPH|nr:hypothetical protein EMEDMD4_1350012 [Sinorhizobium medicae]